MTLPLGASLELLMQALVTAEADINTQLAADHPTLETLTITQWRPTTINPPALFHMIAGAPFEQVDTGVWRDTLRLLTRIAVAHSNYDDEMNLLTTYTDTFREVMDPLIGAKGNQVLGGAARWSERSDMRSVLDTFNEIDYLCMEFVMTFRLDRMIQPT